MDLFGYLKNLNYKYCNLTALSIFGFLQGSKYFLNRNSNDIINSYLNDSKIDSIYHKLNNNIQLLPTGESFDSHITPERHNIRLKNLDSYGFWAVLENKDKNVISNNVTPFQEYIYMKSNHLKYKTSTFMSFKEYKDKPYLIKKKLLKFGSNSSEDQKLNEWNLIKITKINELGKINKEYYKNGLITLCLFSIGFFCTICFGFYRSINVIKTLPIVNFIKGSCIENGRIKEIIGDKIVIRNLEGELKPNYFSGDIVISGNLPTTILINIVVMRDNIKVPFKLLKLNVKEIF